MKAGKTTRRNLTIQMAGSAEEAYEREAAALEVQKKWARDVANGIERGELPTAGDQREVIALILRMWADNTKVTKPTKRGNPAWAKKIYDPDTVALMVGYQIGFGAIPADAIRHVADQFDVDDSTVAKIFRERREAVARWFANSNLKHRVGANRGE